MLLKYLLVALTLVTSIYAASPMQPKQSGETMKNKRVLISGAGVAGLTLAYWLKQHGFGPTIVERHPVLRTWGYKLDIRGSALDVLKRMNIHDLAKLARTDTQGATMIDSFGNKIEKMDADICGGRVQEDLELLRKDLCELLYSKTNDIEFLFDNCITQTTEQENGILVEFEKGKSAVYDLVIGADGLHSGLRKQVFGDESLFLKELGMYVSYCSVPNYLNLDRWEIEYHAPKRFIIVYNAKGDDDLIAGFAFNSDCITSRDPYVQKKCIRDSFSHVGWEASKLIELMQTSPNFYFDCCAQIHMPSWSKGRVALVGDAAYAASPVSGQGTSVAIVGAYILAEELAKAQGNYEKAYAEYENKMRPFVKRNQSLVDLSVALMTEDNSFISHLNRHMSSQNQQDWSLLVKEINAKRIHEAATSLPLL
ncbi:MAG: FAD-dependent monooxygenase [Chlamydiales bacterium]|nr:FAD-dependent monooxygenase [Chlamydiales bacterium]